ncbi:hypothetical protein JCM18899A_38940 [Nocardioides sp. AN3]
MPRISVAQRRSDFVHAAVEVIATHGIDGATTRRIADQAKANVAMLHYCYDSKEDLFADVYELITDKFREVLAECDADADLATMTHQILRSLMQCYLESATFTAATIELVSWARRNHETRTSTAYDQVLETGRALLRGSTTGPQIDSAAIDEIAQLVAMLADGFAVSWLTYGDRPAAEQQMEIAASALDSWLTSRLGLASTVLSKG